MAFLNEIEINKVKEQIIFCNEEVKKEFRLRKNKFHTKSVLNSKLNDFLESDWEVDKTFVKKTRLKKTKTYDEIFRDQVWCQFFELGYRNLNKENKIRLPFCKETKESNEIDVIAINDETIFLIICESSEKLKKAPSYLERFSSLRLELLGYRKVLEQLFGRDIKVKFIFATRNLRFSVGREDISLLEKERVFLYNDNTYVYVNNLIKHYKEASLYQFLGLVFKNEIINNHKIEIPAVQGWMGKKKYYMFSIEPNLLLKLGFILHRTKANDMEFPTYQRLLVPNRLNGISKFINKGGYFPNSIIINFNNEKNKVIFEGTDSSLETKSRVGILKIPNAYAIAYIIDGQHRLYGYANSEYKQTNTIPVVALTNLASEEQLSIFMDINENQKAVKPSLKLDLEEYLYWDSDRLDSRLKALRSSIIKSLSNDINSPLFNKISIGEDVSLLSFKPFSTGLSKSGLLPNAKGNTYDINTISSSLYNINNKEYQKEMEISKKKIVELIIKCYEYIEDNFPHIYEREKYFILSNRGTFAFLALIGSLNKFLTDNDLINYDSSLIDRFEKIEKYLNALFLGIDNLSEEEESKQLSLLGAGADIKWLRFFQMIINKRFNEYEPSELIDWKERQDEELQDRGRSLGISIEKHMKKTVLMKLRDLYSNKWELEIGSIKRECVNRALQEDERNYKEEINIDKTDWKDMFNINDYKAIIEKHWTKKLEEKDSFVTFEKEFSIDMGLGFNSKSEKLKWISRFNSYRNLWAHEGTKEKRLNKEEVDFIEKIYNHFYV